ncbi:hypothetical protein [Corynebacterium kalidii]
MSRPSVVGGARNRQGAPRAAADDVTDARAADRRCRRPCVVCAWARCRFSVLSFCSAVRNACAAAACSCPTWRR